MERAAQCTIKLARSLKGRRKVMRFRRWVWLRRRLVIWLAALAAILWREVQEQRAKQKKRGV